MAVRRWITHRARAGSACHPAPESHSAAMPTWASSGRRLRIRTAAPTGTRFSDCRDRHGRRREQGADVDVRPAYRDRGRTRSRRAAARGEDPGLPRYAFSATRGSIALTELAWRRPFAGPWPASSERRSGPFAVCRARYPHVSRSPPDRVLIDRCRHRMSLPMSPWQAPILSARPRCVHPAELLEWAIVRVACLPRSLDVEAYWNRPEQIHHVRDRAADVQQRHLRRTRLVDLSDPHSTITRSGASSAVRIGILGTKASNAIRIGSRGVGTVCKSSVRRRRRCRSWWVEGRRG